MLSSMFLPNPVIERTAVRQDCFFFVIRVTSGCGLDSTDTACGEDGS